MDFHFGKNYKLCSPTVIDDVFENGTHLKLFPFVAKYKLVNLNENVPFQVVVSAPKRSFKFAYQRNRIKRLVKESLRLNKHSLEEYLLENNQQIALFLIFTSREEIDIKLLNKKTEKLFHTLIQQLQKV